MAPQSASRFYFFHNDHVLFPKDGFPDALLQQPISRELETAIVRDFHFEWSSDTPIYCAEIHQDVALSNDWVAVSMRKALEIVGPDDYTTLARAYAIINWDKNHQYCGRCGASTVTEQHSFEKQCTDCQLHFYPRISPSVIVLIHREDELLMARGHHFPPNVYGLIAGFVEAGESIEEAAHREIMEEVGLKVKNLEFFASQSWPFPDSLMIGFFAEYDDGEIVVEERELESAAWYHYANIPGRPRTSVSIANRLIEQFVQNRRAR